LKKKNNTEIVLTLNSIHNQFIIKNKDIDHLCTILKNQHLSGSVMNGLIHIESKNEFKTNQSIEQS
jgi:hypothetical protein